MRQLKKLVFAPTTRISGYAHDDSIECKRDLEVMISSLNDYLKEEGDELTLESIYTSIEKTSGPKTKVFIVHGHDGERMRARQNVIFETGFFMGKLGRKNIIVIVVDGVEIPSDLQGLVYIKKDDWKLDVCKELREIGYTIDFNKLF